MRKVKQGGLTRVAGATGKIATPSQAFAILAVAAAVILPSSTVFGNEINLVTGTAGAVTGGSFTGGTTPPSASDGVAPDSIYELIDTIPTGTGVFQPFLSYQKKGSEEGVNTSLGGNGQGFLDDKRVPQWTHDLHLGDLGTITRNGLSYYAFELDANETGNGMPNRLISIDDIRIYVTPTSPFAGVSNDTQARSALAALDGTSALRYAQNAVKGSTAATTPNWVLIDASRRTEGSTSGSGSSDMLVLIPTSLFTGVDFGSFLTFYTVNGLHDTGGDDGTDAGFEEWRALVPDGGSTLMLLGSALTALGLVKGRRSIATKA
jgi:hypothetical protein